ncbi:MAG: hypothetical protein A2Y12_01300 [Planctomycetes bacterium GWF2_42_9]|nr:MAG: hypothetical protein A2Y12_01300 [Planctomycetes bacterium GWF2_42_9]
MNFINYNFAMIALAREFRGWTQKQLSDAIGISQATISKYELGSVPPTSEDIELIARVLSFSTELFKQPDQIFALGSSLIFHRKRVNIPMRIQKRVQAEVNLRNMQISRLLRPIEFDHKFHMIPPEAAGDNPERVAREVRRLWGISSGPIADLTRIVENAGGIIVHVDFGTHLIDGAHLWITGMPPVFFMNQAVSGERYRFSLAHEVGHAIMHHSSALDDVEEEATLFASEFLMPRSEIRSDLHSLSLESAARLKKVWKVAMQAIIMRASTMRAISESKKKRLFAAIGAKGYRVNEPWPIPLEKPETYSKLIDLHLNKLGISQDEFYRSVMFTSKYGEIECVPRLKLMEND